MDIERLMTFVEAAQSLNFSQTARRLHLSQPTVSKHIQSLEAELKLDLFERMNGSLRLTPAGQALLPWARQVLRECQKFQDIASSLHEKVSGELRIVCTTASGRHILPRLAARFKMKFEHVQIKISVASHSEGIALLKKGAVDLAAISSEIREDGLESQWFFTDEIVLIAPAGHPWTGMEGIELDELLSEPIILREATSGTRQVLRAELARRDIALDELNILMEIGTADGIVSAVAAGLGVAFVSRAAAHCAVQSGLVREVPLRGVKLSRQIYLVRNGMRALSRPVDLFWGFVHEPENQDLF